MGKGVYLLTVKAEFCASHCLRGYQGACESLHGHNFTVEVTVKGSRLTGDTELLMDFKEIKALLGQVLSRLDHSHLNDLPPFDRQNPSSENLAAFVYDHMKQRLEATDVAVHQVSVSEKDTSKATYYEE
jgi:6-pyruvoyltetrahydropterin/6-carboxytetrahydropterin synthase